MDFTGKTLVESGKVYVPGKSRVTLDKKGKQMKPSRHIVVASLATFIIAVVVSELADAKDYRPIIFGMPLELVIGISLSMLLSTLIAIEAHRLSKMNDADN